MNYSLHETLSGMIANLSEEQFVVPRLLRVGFALENL